MKIKNIKINNILSISDASLSFDDNGLVLVEGWNYDAERANGAGKTAIFNAISFGLFDKIPRKITASEILKRDAKQGYSEITLSSGSDTWRVKRFRPKNVEFYRNDIKLDISQQEFESHIRFTYDQFVLTVYNSQSNIDSPRFLLRSDSDKKSFLLQLLNLNVFSEAKKNVDDIIKSKTLDLETNLSKIRNAESKIDAYNESLIDTSSLQEEITSVESKINSIDLEIQVLSQIERPDISKFRQIEDDLQSKQNEIISARATLSQLHDRYREMSRFLETVYDIDAKCTECGSSLDTPEARELHKKKHSETSLKMKALKSKIDELDTVVLKDSSLRDLSIKIRDKKSNILSEYQDAVNKITSLKSSRAILENKNTLLSAKIKTNQDLLNKIDRLRDSIASSIKQTEEQKTTLEIYKTLSTMFSPTGAQAYILDSLIESFNEIVKNYVDIVWPNTSYSLHSYKETAKGDVVAKFSETLTMQGSEVSIGSLSGGELRALSLCVDFALLEVLSSRFGLELNPIILDEPFDGLDSVGRETVISLLSNLAADHQILVVDHASESKASFSRVIRVEKKNGSSSLIEES